MKESLEFLPEEKQKELREIAEFVKNEVEQVRMIILFGSYARGDWVSDSYTENGTLYTYESDYDLLFIVNNESVAKHRTIDKKIEKRIMEAVNPKTPLGIIYHGMEHVNLMMFKSSYFFVDIYREGIVLYDDGKFKLEEPRIITKEERYKKAKNYFDIWFPDSNTFLKYAKLAINSEDLKIAALNLHQATEKYFTTTCLVFNDYKPKTHNLYALNMTVSSLDFDFTKVFPTSTEEEKRLFEVLCDAYIKSRYDVNYSVAREDLEYLENRISILRDLTEKICLEKLEQLKVDYKKLKNKE